MRLYLETLQRGLRVNEALRVGPDPIWLVPLQEEEIWTHRETGAM